MTQPTLNEYFTLTNDLLFKLIVSSVPHSINKDVGSTMVFSIDSETMNSADSIGVGLQVGDFMTLGVQTVTAWRSAHLRTKDLASELLSAQSPGIKEIEDAQPVVAVSFVQNPGSRQTWKTPRTLHLSDFGLFTPFEDKLTMVVIPLPSEDESFTPPLCQEDQWRWFIKEARPHTQSPIIKALFKMDPVFEVMQRNLDRLSDQKQICEVMKKRYLRMQEVIQEEEKAAMRA